MSPIFGYTPIALGVLLVAGAASAQDVPDFNKMRTPTSPAFIILGISPTEIERPSVPSTLALGLLSKANEARDVIPDSYALEVAPYWLLPHPRLTFAKYDNGGAASIIRNFTLSIATTDSVSENVQVSDADAYRRVGVGIRTMLVTGKSGAKGEKCIASINAAATNLAVAIGQMFSDSLMKDPSIARLTPQDSMARRKEIWWQRALDSIPQDQREVIEEKVTDCAKELSVRTGWVVSGAAAAAWAFPDGKAESGRATTGAIWLTPSLLGEKFSNVGILRLRWEDLDRDTTGTGFDVGLRSIYAFDRFATSVEAIYRSIAREDVTDSGLRLSLIADARVTDDSWVTITVGRDFDVEKDRSLLANISFSWQLGDRVITPDR